MHVDQTEIEQLFVDCHQRLQAVARQILKDDEDASDAVSDVFARFADGSLKVPEDHPERYLTVTVRNLCLDRIRLMTVRQRIEHRLSLNEPKSTLMDGEQERVAEMLNFAEMTFPKQTWRVFQLRFDEGLLYREIAERMGISEVTVYKHLAEALRKLKEKFNPTR